MDFDPRVYEKAELILKHLRGETTWEEEEALRAWLAEDERNRLFMKSLLDDEALKADLEFFKSDNASSWDHIAERTFRRMDVNRSSRLKVWRYAAVIALFCVAGSALVLLNYNSRDTVNAGEISALQEQDVAPGGSKARLKLADGTVIALEDVDDGEVQYQKGVRVLKQSDELIYERESAEEDPKIALNEVFTPKGGQFKVVLPDGTKVWLNCASSLQFPTAFLGDARIVEMTGEAYFEVAEDSTRPFTVKVGDATVKVFGTHFNVMAYNGKNAVETTLLEGSVQVTNGSTSKMMIPGQQALIGDDIRLHEVDPIEVVAWKDRLFHFNNTSLADIMVQLERWYNIEVNYDSIPPLHYTGRISMNSNVSRVLEMLELTGPVDFKIDGRVVTILEK